MFLLLCGGCRPDSRDVNPEDSASEPTYEQDSADMALAIPEVEIVEASLGQLPLRRRTNGQLRARRQIEFRSQTGGIVITAPTEGAFYSKGELLFATDQRNLRLALDRAKSLRDEADFRHQELLLRMQANLAAEDTLTDLARRNILIQSGLPTAEVALREAQLQLELASQYAPFPCRVADLKIQEGQLVSSGEPICTLFDPSSLEVEFNLLEQEVAQLGGQGRVTVEPLGLPGQRFSAKLDILNPLVDEGGLLRARAILRGYGKQKLYPGMNVAVTLAGRSPEMTLLPKAAVIVRSGRSLVFVYEAESGRAKWQYVTVAYENDDQVALAEGVEPGQAVIVSGNLTLDHDSPVRLAK